MKQKQKGNVAVIALIIVIVAITASVITWMVATKTQAPVQQEAVAQPTAPVAQTRPASNESVAPKNSENQETKGISTQFSAKGWLLIFTEQSEIADTNLKLNTWYLVNKDSISKNFTFQDYDKNKSKVQHIELAFSNTTECVYPENESDSGTNFLCMNKQYPDPKWGSGDRVRLVGKKDENRIKVEVEKMEIVSALPVEKW